MEGGAGTARGQSGPGAAQARLWEEGQGRQAGHRESTIGHTGNAMALCIAVQQPGMALGAPPRPCHLPRGDRQGW